MIRKVCICNSCKKENISSSSEIYITVGKQRDTPSGRTEDVDAQAHLCDECAKKFWAELKALEEKRRGVIKKYGFTVGSCFPVSPTSPKGY